MARVPIESDLSNEPNNFFFQTHNMLACDSCQSHHLPFYTHLISSELFSVVLRIVTLAGSFRHFLHWSATLTSFAALSGLILSLQEHNCSSVLLLHCTSILSYVVPLPFAVPLSALSPTENSCPQLSVQISLSFFSNQLFEPLLIVIPHHNPTDTFPQ